MKDGLMVSGFKYTTKNETLHGCLDEKNKKDEKKTTQVKVTSFHKGFNRVLIFLKLIPY
jgi:hypothetical protein